jgi:adenylosuccinate synthase
MKAGVVIGAGFGDEGKGVVTSLLAADAGEDALVIRFNGGAQAGHTVVSGSRRHVFSHFSSGSFTGAATFLSRYFVANPLLFLKEREALGHLGIRPRILAEADMRITTPFDMLINQMSEIARGADRHGSCGVGFGETVERSLVPRCRLHFSDLAGDPARCRRRLRALLIEIRDNWVSKRLAALGLADAASRPELAGLVTVVGDDEFIYRWIEDALEFAAGIEISNLAPVRTAARHGSLVFEGAQGLLLDQDRGWFPHVTRSNTGLRNVLEIAERAGIDGLDVTYVTRAYLTRHGRGPLPGELAHAPYSAVVDETNVENPYQGRLRYAWLDLDLLGRTIAADLGDARGASAAISPRLAVTCLDQVEGQVTFVKGGARRSTGEAEFLDAALRQAGLEDALALRRADGSGATVHTVPQIRLSNRRTAILPANCSSCTKPTVRKIVKNMTSV